MNPKSRRPTHEETCVRILEKADELFRQYGYGKTTVGDIAGELGMSAANIYKFFPSKLAIVQGSADRNLAKMMEELGVIVGSRGSAMGRIEKCILSIFRSHTELLKNEKQMFKLVVSAIEEGWSCIRKFDEFMMEILTRLLREGMERGEFAKGKADVIARALLDSLSVVLRPHMRYGGIHDGSEARVRAQLEFLCRALKK